MWMQKGQNIRLSVDKCLTIFLSASVGTGLTMHLIFQSTRLVGLDPLAEGVQGCYDLLHVAVSCFEMGLFEEIGAGKDKYLIDFTRLWCQNSNDRDVLGCVRH